MRGSRRRRSAGGLCAAAALALFASPAAAIDLQTTGWLSVTWHGDPARGCAAVGECGVTGSVRLGSDAADGGSPPSTIELFTDNAVVRVSDVAADGSRRDCTDLVPLDVSLAIARGPSGLRALPHRVGANELPSAGRCAGPLPSDQARVALPARRVGLHRYDISGHTTFGAGPFSVTESADIHVVPSGGADSTAELIGGGGSSTSQPGGRRVLIEQVEVDYRVTSATGMLTAAFTGSPDPFCQPLGSCGEHGTLTEQLSAADHRLSFYGARIVKRRVSSRKVLADLRAGRFRLENGMPSALRGTLSETIGAPGAAACTDRVGVSGLVISARSQGAMDRFGILTSDQSGDGSSSTADPSRTHCQGPMSTDLDRGGVMALARVPIDSLLGPG